MRGPLLVASLLLVVMMSGCLADVQDGTDGDETSGPGTSSGNEVVGADSEGNPIREGDALGTITYDDTGDAGIKGYSTQCDDPANGVTANVGVIGGPDDHRWTIPSGNNGGIAWKAKVLTIEVTQETRTSTDLDVFVYDQAGNFLGRSYEEGPDDESGVNTATFVGLFPGTLTMRVINCGGVATEYTITGTADMVARASGSIGSGGPCTVTPTSNGFEASRTEQYDATLTGSTGAADISTGAGHISYTGGNGDDYTLVATLKARGDTEQQACERLAEMYVDHTAEDGASVALDVHGRPGGNGQWKQKQIDLVFDAPASIDWKTFLVSSSAGYVHVDSVTGTKVDVHTSAGYVQIDDVDADSLDADTSAGYVQVRGTRAGDMRLSTSAGYVDAIMDASTQSGDWDLDASAGSIDLRVKETSSIGYDVDARTSAGSVSFDFDDVEQTQSDCQYASCHRKGKTNGYDSRSIKVSIDMDTSAGSITAGS